MRKMARSTSSYLVKIKSYLNLCHKESKVYSSLNKVPVRYLRGSRYGKDNNSEELRYQRLLRTLRYESKSSDPEASPSESIAVPASAAENSLQCASEKESSIMVAPIDLVKKLEEKFSPMKDMEYELQLIKKYKRTLGILRLLGQKLKSLKVPIEMGREQLPCPVDDIIPSPVTTTTYRNKDEFNIGLGLDGSEKTVGFFLDTPTEFSTPFCISSNELPTVRENHKKFAEDFQNYIRLSPLPALQHFSDRGYWKSLIARSNSAEDVMGIVVIHPQDLSEKDLEMEKEKLRDYFSCIPKSSYNLQSLYFQTCVHSRCTHEQSPLQLVLGEDSISEEVGSLSLHLSPDSFFHVNTRAAEAMFRHLLKLCRVSKATTVFDIACGVGPVSCLFSPRVKQCIGIDDSIQAIQDARRNASQNRAENTEFIYGRPENLIREVLSKNYHEDLLVVLNSSRCTINRPVISLLREFRSVDKIVYISSKPQSAIENILHLCKPCGSARNLGQAFLPILAVPVDLCPHTDQFGMLMMLQRL